MSKERSSSFLLPMHIWDFVRSSTDSLYASGICCGDRCGDACGCGQFNCRKTDRHLYPPSR
eukprot:scaffold3343_cov51-Cyclotella_meneghiniana.AAC.2